MNEKELKELIEKGETQTLEFKEKFDRDVIETAAAFANAKGGVIFIGVGDNGEIKGATVGKETLKAWSNEISQATEPTIIPYIESYQIRNKTIVKVAVEESPLKPASYKGACYIRLNNSNRKLSPKEISEIYLHTIGSSWDFYPARGATLEDIDVEKVKKYIILANETGRRKITEAPLQALEKLELIKENKPSWAAILLFGKTPQKILLQARIHCGRFKISKTEIMDDRMIEGNLISQTEEAVDFIKKHMSVRFAITGKPRREEIWEYPLEALREGVANAIVHRDYTLPSETSIEIYDDRIEIWNPGKLPLGISIDDLYKEYHKSIPRNKMVAQIFFDLELIEKYGSGTIRMLEACKKSGIFLEFKEISNGFSIIFRKDIYTEDYLRGLGLNERQIKAVMYVKQKGKITNREYREISGLSDEGVRIDINKLIEKNILQESGKGRNTFYIIKKIGD